MELILTVLPIISFRKTIFAVNACSQLSLVVLEILITYDNDNDNKLYLTSNLR